MLSFEINDFVWETRVYREIGRIKFSIPTSFFFNFMEYLFVKLKLILVGN